MFFSLSKVFWMAAAPSNLMVFAIVIGVALLWTRHRRLGRWLLTATAVVAVGIAVTPWPRQALIVLEDRFPLPVLPDRVDGIVVLAGMVDLTTSEARGAPALTDAIERVLVGAELAARYPEARLVFTGGSGNLFRPDLSESLVIRPVFAQLGVGERVLYEGRSRNTFENAELTAELVDPKPDEVWVVVTSAFHMPRAVGCFRAVGWQVIPYPADHRTDGDANWWPPQIAFGTNLRHLDFAAHEWIGLVAYRLTGRSDALFPRPDG